METKLLLGKTEYFLRQGDLTQEATDAIVNAANSGLEGGGGVDGAIHRRGGPSILEACREIVGREGKCPPGEAVITPGGDLPARFVIHAVGPIWQGGEAGEPETLVRCYRRSLEVARLNALKSIAFPSISTGAYRFPVELAARLAQEAVIAEIAREPYFTRVGFVLFDARTYEAYLESLSRLLPGVGG